MGDLYSNDPFGGRRAQPQGVPRKHVHQRAPTSADTNVTIFDFWGDPVSKTAYICTGNTGGVATWEKLAESLDFQESVLAQVAEGAATETQGYRYLSTTTGTLWIEDYIYEYKSGAWEGQAPSDGMVVFDEDTAGYLLYSSAAWGSFTTGISTIAAATDVTITTAAEANMLIFDTVWKNQAISGDATIVKGGAMAVSDLTITSEARGDLLRRGATAWERVAAKTDEQILIGDGTDITSVAVSGDIAITNLGAVTVTGITVGSDAQGDIYIQGAAGLERLGAGVAGLALVTAGAASNPYWGTPSVGSATTLANGCILSDSGANDATLAFTTQTVGTCALTVPDFASVADTFVFTTLAQTLASKTLTAPDINGGTADSLTGFSIRSSSAAFDLEQDTAEALSGNKIISWNVADTNRSITLSGNIALGGTLTTLGSVTGTGAFTLGYTLSNNTTITLPVTGTLATLAGSEAFTNKTMTAPAITGGSAIELTSFSLRSSGSAFDLLQATSEVLTGDKTISWNVGDTARAITLGGDIALGGTLTTLAAWTQTGAHTIGITTTAATAITLPVAGIVTATTSAGTAGQVIIGATGATGEFATIAHTAGSLTSTAGVNTLNIDTAESMIRTATVAVSAAEIKALNAAPKQLIAAPGTGKYIDFLGAVIALDFGSTAYDDAAADGDFQIRYDASTVLSLTVESDGLVDAVADAASTAKPLATDVTLLGNTKVELFNDGAEITGGGGGDGALKVIINYRILDLS